MGREPWSPFVMLRRCFAPVHLPDLHAPCGYMQTHRFLDALVLFEIKKTNDFSTKTVSERSLTARHFRFMHICRKLEAQNVGSNMQFDIPSADCQVPSLL